MKTGICILWVLLINLQYAKAYDPKNYYTDPILILASNDNFGLFTGEVLKTEGFNEFQILSPTDTKVNLGYLKKFDIIILAENILTAKLQSMFTSYVSEGGNLIAFRPDKKLGIFCACPYGFFIDSYIYRCGMGLMSLIIHTSRTYPATF